MKFPFIKHPKTGTPDAIITMSILVTSAAVIKFLLDGVAFSLGDHFAISFGHMDSTTYLALLSPVLGLHGYTDSLKIKDSKQQGEDSK